METEALLHLKQQIEARTGLRVRDQDLGKFCEVVAARIEYHRLASPGDYQRLLRGHAVTSEPEWQKLASLITIGESYFFRDKGQFAVLREQILPELIAVREPQRTLKIWSAGCSSGEEPYSLAILLGELLPRQVDWQVRILGSDIDGDAIDKARQGIYSPWSFRMCGDELQRDYFTGWHDAWKIKTRIRSQVGFHAGNLLDLPSGLLSELKDVDLIICRNVFIYFKPEAIAQVLATFVRLLREGGYLMTGHGELYGHGLGLKTFKAKICEGSVIYQKIDPGACLPAPKATEVVRQPQGLPTKSAPAACKPSPKPGAAPLKHNSGRTVKKTPVAAVAPKPLESPAPLDDLFSRGDYAAAIVLGESLLKQDPKNFEVLLLLAQAHANMGQHNQATILCQQMLQIRPQAASPYFLLAHLAEAQGDRQEAKKLFKKVIYLDPGCVAAYFELTGLYTREHDGKRAETMRQTVLALLKSMAPDQRVEHYQKVTAGELMERMGKVA